MTTQEKRFLRRQLINEALQRAYFMGKRLSYRAIVTSVLKAELKYYGRLMTYAD